MESHISTVNSNFIYEGKRLWKVARIEGTFFHLILSSLAFETYNKHELCIADGIILSKKQRVFLVLYQALWASQLLVIYCKSQREWHVQSLYHKSWHKRCSLSSLSLVLPLTPLSLVSYTNCDGSNVILCLKKEKCKKYCKFNYALKFSFPF